MTLKDLIWPQATEKKHIHTDYRKAGLSAEESEIVGFIHQKFYYGYRPSLAAGLFCATSVGLLGFYKDRPTLRYGIIGATGISAYLIYDYVTRYDRKSANTNFGNTYTNNLYNTNKRIFSRTFHTFNRKFIKEEIEQFLFNEKLHRFGRKNYVYNEYVHPAKKEHRIKHDTFNDGKQYLSSNMKDLIKDQNAEKILNGEEVMMKPYKITDHCDHTGVRIQVPTVSTSKLGQYMAN